MTYKELEEEYRSIKDRYNEVIKKEIIRIIVDDIDCKGVDREYLLGKITKKDLENITDIVVEHEYLNEELNCVIENAIDYVMERK